MSFNFPNSPTNGQTFQPIVNGITYVYQNGQWQVKPNEPPFDGQTYGRKDGAWADVTEEAPTDGVTYGRKTGAWVPSIGGAFCGDAPPSPPLTQGQLWYETDSGNTYVWYDDGTSTQWVMVAAAAASGEFMKKTGDTMSGDLIVRGDANGANGNTIFSGPAIELGSSRPSDGYSFIDLHSQFPDVDYSARILRNPGVNGALDIVNSGTGGINFTGLLSQPWTPVVRFGGNNVGLTYTQQTGRYIKIGGLVMLWAWVVLSAKGSSVGAATISGIPFPALGNLAFYSGNIGYMGPTSFANPIGCGVPTSGSAINLYKGSVQMTDGDFAATTSFMLNVSYEAA